MDDPRSEDSGRDHPWPDDPAARDLGSSDSAAGDAPPSDPGSSDPAAGESPPSEPGSSDVPPGDTPPIVPGQGEAGPDTVPSDATTPDAAAALPSVEPSTSPPPSPTVNWEQGAGRPLDVPGAPGFIFAPILARVVGFVVDGIILFVFELFVFGLALAIVGSPQDLQGSLDPLTSFDPVTSVVVSLVGVVVSWLYFVGFWRSSQRATPGQRLVKIQVGRAFDGRTLTVEQATSRWFAMAFPFQVFSAIPALSDAVTGIFVLWYLVLLIATAASGTRQGPHDHFGRSAVVQRVGVGQSGIVLGCFLVIAVLAVAMLAFVVALVLLGSQIEEILRQVGESI